MRYVSNIRQSLEEIEQAARVALSDLEGLEVLAEACEEERPRQGKAQSRARCASVVFGCYLALSAVAARVDGPFQLIPQWKLDNHVHLIARTDRALRAFENG